MELTYQSINSADQIVIAMTVRTTSVAAECRPRHYPATFPPPLSRQTGGAKSKETRTGSERDIILINNLDEIILT